jgi:hypothetical protein
LIVTVFARCTRYPAAINPSTNQLKTRHFDFNPNRVTRRGVEAG